MRKIIRICSILCALVFITPTATASLITSDLNITGNVEFDTVNSTFTTGNATQNADMSLVIGGGTSLTTIANITPTGVNPLGGTLTDYGDGVGVSAIASTTAGVTSEVPDFIFDIGFSLSNSSATDSYQIFFELAFSNFSDADGSDAFVDAEINLFNSLLDELFFSDLTSDTAFGDQKNGTALTSSGATLSDSGTFLFDITLLAGASNSFSALLKMDGGAFDNTSIFNARTSAFISVVSADNLTNTPQPPSPVPEPSTFILFFIAMLLLQVKRRAKN
ncbi:PEP-CTERM sorting domain-containing protein [Colwellia sp. PAMC 21821]|uniref:PEP-CTERM sorting domain-containing protein n=1 Tax=Colwellia sp. PAMC 21821 TaxID=1816219 RepID=UPI0009BD88A4|nr:PEP-CTERM sorting domain-containing protein [Colwellia sp. PAMC 21821]ARD43170.1 hypothetical protein A3Q33_01865 [Colwellia sp. PAMC 21821]